ncbi:hypothetical protein CCACVL1_18898 [Corchorus capsularis]|uniref:No apical meristem (NAM) protein n=1 Tax=Corchorus capsularis TaxID=210143 RepID=A0A1R3HJJ4_COCAP|nr:hypothetical protein CCACVL1_18898 [Corchorus capsularis]
MEVTKMEEADQKEVWTLCRIFKRDVSHKKYATEWLNNKKNMNILSKQNSNASSSCSLESDNDIKIKNFGVFDETEIERKIVNDPYNLLGRNQFFAAGTTTTHQVPSYFSFSNSNPNEDEFFGQQNWDELRPMVDYTHNLGSSLLYSEW